MNKNRKGFTLIELVVVVLIIGILTAIGLPYYLKTIEISKASDALAIGHLLGNSYRMYLVDNPTAPLSGAVTNTCNSAACSAAGVCKLVACNYVAQQNWDAGAYSYSIGGANASSVSRKTTGAGSTTTPPYNGWGYTFSTAGICTAVGGAPSCPSF